MSDKELHKKIKQEFDWKFYVSYYPDLSHVTDKFVAWNHYKHYGFFENRFYNKEPYNKQLKETENEINKLKFNWKFYVSHHDDINHIIDKETAWDHYKNYGILEKRSYNKKIQLKQLEEQKYAASQLKQLEEEKHTAAQLKQLEEQKYAAAQLKQLEEQNAIKLKQLEEQKYAAAQLKQLEEQNAIKLKQLEEQKYAAAQLKQLEEQNAIKLKQLEEQKYAAAQLKQLEEQKQAAAQLKQLEEEKQAAAQLKQLEEQKQAAAQLKQLEEEKQAAAQLKQLEEQKQAAAQLKQLEEEIILIDNIITNTNPYILIVMPTYNRSEYIEKSIKYMKNQIYKKFCLLIIDDGSNLQHKIKFNELKEKYKLSNKIIFIENKINYHIAKTLNIGIKYFCDNQQFTHFTWISDDNKYYSNFLNELIIDNTYFKYTSFDIQELNGIKCTNDTSYKGFNDILNNFNGCASFMWTKEAIKNIGKYDETIPGCEDYEYLLRTFKFNALGCNYTNIPTMKYIRHANSLMEQQRDTIMNIKHKIVVDYKLRYIDTICYVKYPETDWAYFYNDKTTKIIDIFNSVSKNPLKTVSLQVTAHIFDTNKVNIHRNEYTNIFASLYNFCLGFQSNKIYIFNELDYSTFKAFYESHDINKKCLINFLTKVTYIITFTEIFKNDNFQTIGNTSYNKEYSNYLFKNAYKILLCHTTNVELIYNHISPDNLLYNPPITYDTNMECIQQNKVKDIDFLFYGSCVANTFVYRETLLNIVRQYSETKGYNFKVYNKDLFGKEKDDILARSKIIIHVGSLPNLTSIPWAKITELMIKGVFFCVEHNPEQFKIKDVIPPCYSYSYIDNIPNTNICEVLDYYLLNPKEMEKYIKYNKEYILQYNNSNMISNLINYNENINNIVKSQFNFNRARCNITTINGFYYGTQNFHSNLKNQYKCFVEKHKISFCYKETFPYIFSGFRENKVKFFNFLSNYIPDNTCLYMFNAEDLMAFYYYYDAKNMELIYKFINTAKYILFQYEVIVNVDLTQIGLTASYLTNNYSFDCTKFERDKFLKDFCKNSQKMYVCSTVNNNFLKINSICNTVYFPPYINIPFEIIHKHKTTDCLFYGYLLDVHDYRNTFIAKIKPDVEALGLNFITHDNLHDDKLNSALNDTKIVLHIPSHENLETMPWAKITYLMVNKIFFIIEENEEMYTKNLQNIIVFYKHGDKDDLKQKIVDFINNEDSRQKVVEECYNYYMSNFNANILLDDLRG